MYGKSHYIQFATHLLIFCVSRYVICLYRVHCIYLNCRVWNEIYIYNHIHIGNHRWFLTNWLIQIYIYEIVTVVVTWKTLVPLFIVHSPTYRNAIYGQSRKWYPSHHQFPNYNCITGLYSYQSEWFMDKRQRNGSNIMTWTTLMPYDAQLCMMRCHNSVMLEL